MKIIIKNKKESFIHNLLKTIGNKGYGIRMAKGNRYKVDGLRHDESKPDEDQDQIILMNDIVQVCELYGVEYKIK
tara:strand:- start:533 stop:757 length:225 start_codon:yes stop_codon:yes gene_type:complete